MSKHILWILTVALSLALLGLIFIQVSWIRSAVELKDKQFQQLVNTTLTDVSRQLDRYYTTKRMNAIIEEKLAEESGLNWLIDPDLYDPSLNLEGSINNSSSTPIDKSIREDLAEIVGDSVIVITHHDGAVVDTINISGYQDEESRKKLEQSLREQQVMVATIMKRMLLDNVSFGERIEQGQLEKVLSRYLADRGVNLDYEYTVIRDNRKEIYSSENFNRNTGSYYYRTSLLSDEILNEETYLYLYFPGQQELVRSSLGFLVFSTLVLTILMIILFTFALYVIFKQKRLSEIKNDFVNNMTHELKTPISTISLASQMLNDESISAERKNSGHIARIIQTESKRLGYQVERVLQMAVLDQGHLVLKRKEVGMCEIVSTVVQNFKLQVETQSGKLEVIDESTYDIVNGDKVHLVNVVTNLLDNAIKYSGGTPDITVHMRNSSRQFKLSVKDKGIGISKDNQKKVFDRFYRVSTGNVHDVKGFGLGLSYVKLIVEQHGGSINLSSELNKGTQFIIELPLQSEKEIS
jgi:two-component system, OmpR family, phosphate regulon sensor histidine kinase PhoR